MVNRTLVKARAGLRSFRKRVGKEGSGDDDPGNTAAGFIIIGEITQTDKIIGVLIVIIGLCITPVMV